MKIKGIKKGYKWLVVDRSGKVLSQHKTYYQANKRCPNNGIGQIIERSQLWPDDRT